MHRLGFGRHRMRTKTIAAQFVNGCETRITPKYPMNYQRLISNLVLSALHLAIACTSFGYHDLQMTGDSGRIDYYQSYDSFGSVSYAENEPGSFWCESDYPNSETVLDYFGNDWVQRHLSTYTWYAGTTHTSEWSYSPVFGAYSSNVIMVYRSSGCLLSFMEHGYAPTSLGGGAWVLQYAN